MTNNMEKWESCGTKIRHLKDEIAKVIVGQDEIIEQMLTSLFAGGHCLIIGVPGLAKTLLVSTLAKTLGLSFNRIQFTPDMMPSDILGCEILQETDGRNRQFKFVKGPVFANLILADEINRTPPKTQSALLEAMQEKQVTAAGRSMRLEEPFIVYATQNPIEHEGTYPLPEAQLDRFFFSLNINYPKMNEEREIVLRTTGKVHYEPQNVLSINEVLEFQNIVLDIPVPENALDYVLKLVQASRPEASGDTESFIKKYVAWGAGPRASQNLIRAAKALALLNMNPSISIEDIRKSALPVLRHRIIPNYNAVGEGITVEDIISHLLENVK
ncbi:MAG: AAA family ATPase [Lentisphaerae bacterium GWF2_44_16]|nr:MAG: AAA family ATPase [Lentisphaerae bacterium GWF2_44_16]